MFHNSASTTTLFKVHDQYWIELLQRGLALQRAGTTRALSLGIARRQCARRFLLRNWILECYPVMHSYAVLVKTNQITRNVFKNISPVYLVFYILPNLNPVTQPPTKRLTSRQIKAIKQKRDCTHLAPPIKSLASNPNRFHHTQPTNLKYYIWCLNYYNS